MPSPAEDQQILLDFLERVPDNDPVHFLTSVRDHVRSGRELTERQAVVVARIMGERDSGVEPQPIERAAEALVDDMTGIYNGVYTMNDGNEHLTYRIHTVQRGSLQGKRIIKRQTRYGEFEGFGFLRTDGTVQVWRRFAPDAARNERYIVWAHILVNVLHSSSPNEMVDSFSHEGSHYEIQVSVHCRRCNRPLTTPSSLDGGIGPECAHRDAQRTTAAAPHEQITMDITANDTALRNSLLFRRDSGDRVRFLQDEEPPPVIGIGGPHDRPMDARPGDAYVEQAAGENRLYVFTANAGWQHVAMGLTQAARTAGQTITEFSRRLDSVREVMDNYVQTYGTQPRATVPPRRPAARQRAVPAARMSEIDTTWLQ